MSRPEKSPKKISPNKRYSRKDNKSKEEFPAVAKYEMYANRPDIVNFNDTNYPDYLLMARHLKEIHTLIGLDKIYRRIGEYYEQEGDLKKAVENWKIAVQMNPDVGIKCKLEATKKKL